MQEPSDVPYREENIQAAVHNAIGSWNPYTRRKDKEGKDTELRKLHEYLQHQRELREYEVYKESALQEARELYIKKAIEEFESLERASVDEDKMWSWSPLYQALLRHPLADGPKRSWKHTKDELEEVMRILGEEVGSFRSSLESECPHVVRALKLYMRMTEGRGVPLAHPMKGMTRSKLLHIAMDGVESRRLSVCAQDLVDIGFTYFPCTFGKTNEPTHTSCSDRVALMGFLGWRQDAVLQKVENFLRRIARRAIVDLNRIQEYKLEVAAMWYTPPPEDPAALRHQCKEVGYI